MVIPHHRIMEQSQKQDFVKPATTSKEWIKLKKITPPCRDCKLYLTVEHGQQHRCKECGKSFLHLGALKKHYANKCKNSSSCSASKPHHQSKERSRGELFRQQGGIIKRAPPPHFAQPKTTQEWVTLKRTLARMQIQERRPAQTPSRYWQRFCPFRPAYSLIAMSH